MNETDLNNENEEEISAYDQMLKDEADLRELMWSQLETDEQVIMRVYRNNLSAEKEIHPKLAASVQLIMDRYPDFDMSCVP